VLSPFAPPSGDLPPSPDEFKALYGYEGLYYNVSNLDGRVAVIDKSVYVWPTATWKASGLVRNQTRSGTHVTRLTARLLGKNGAPLATATANLFVDDLRPGEPGPFMIEAPVARGEVAAIDWQVESGPWESVSRPFVIERAVQRMSFPNGLTYWMLGSIHNEATTTVRNVRVVVAWLDADKRVRYVVSPDFRRYLDRPETASSTDLLAGEDRFFTYDPREQWLVSLLDGLHELAIWGVSK
jgi:hypothetical protein